MSYLFKISGGLGLIGLTCYGIVQLSGYGVLKPEKYSFDETGFRFTKNVGEKPVLIKKEKDDSK